MKIDEIQCIKELRNGSYQAFTQIYEAYADRLYSFVLKQLKNRSLTQDIVQDTFLRLWDNRSQLNSFGNLQAFIFTIAKHQVIDYFRKQVNELQFEDFMEYCENQESDVSPEDLWTKQRKTDSSQTDCQATGAFRANSKELSDFRSENPSQRNNEI